MIADLPVSVPLCILSEIYIVKRKITEGQKSPDAFDLPEINPYHDGFLKWNNPPYIFGTFHYHF